MIEKDINIESMKYASYYLSNRISLWFLMISAHKEVYIWSLRETFL